jgi:hypothetical protein
MATPVHPSQNTEPRWTAQTVGMSVDILDQMERAVAKVRERLLRSTAALNLAAVPYAVIGGNAVASWVATVDIDSSWLTKLPPQLAERLKQIFDTPDD